MKKNVHFGLANGMLWLLCILVCGFRAEGILILGILKMVLVTGFDREFIIGFFAASVPLLLLFYLSKGAAIGGGDVKLMAAAGVFLGWENIVLALFLGCIIGAFVHILRMKIQGAERTLAMGPYLAVGILLAELFGETWIGWYLSL